ncbi:hypothetical protein PtrSN002B_006413 [Pyrenophora tritici-repentis]|uniref:Atrophin-1 multi-domain protein n=2 Tax=Pyrenophora tritici-repentis TaxID=45151 RepID=A0A2W1DRE0_9PLEO|nr:hypothetical protein A1F99_086450 [Pyrenophora tritici-repentis]KAF7569546.1 Atrophin-1 multi-domain protein [Pyrenophora tritici-repentis]KAI0582259.1 hypothetical protein Alg130_06227 [Pyrenophora tritici-repentis]KAI0609993.1 hypothetical protein TUN205_05769 [Pyrenophora tritici-repentis]KAI0621966.1 hypothetical protein TUN199_06051 [Pyrenophora tritici-repentis]
MPDLNTLPASSPHTSSPSPRTQSPSNTRMATSPHSLAATAAMNAGMHNEETRRPSSGSMRRDVERARRRSSIRMNLNLNDPAMPAPGELQQSSPSTRSRGPWPHSPHHERAPSLGELHQELEYEQEGQVNRLLNMIRTQQAQINTLQANQHQASASAVDDSTPTSERSMSIPPPLSHSSHVSPPMVSPLPSAAQPRSRSPFGFGTISRQSSFADRSRHSSHAGSPALRPVSGQVPYDPHDMLPSPATSRDESAFYQAETQNLTRENQMLKLRIRELERQLADQNPTSQVTHSPVIHSNLAPTPSREGTDQGAESGSQPPVSTAE